MSLSSYEYEGAHGYGTYVAARHNLKYAPEAGFDTFLENILKKMAGPSGRDKWDQTQFENLADHLRLEIGILTDLFYQVAITTLVPAITRDDTSATAPWSRATYSGLKDWLLGPAAPTFSTMAIAIARIYTVAIQMGGPGPGVGYNAHYVLPLTKQYTASAFETQLSSLAAEESGLIMANHLGVAMRKLNASDFEALAVSYHSDIGRSLGLWIPFRDDTSITGWGFDGSTDIIFDQYMGIGASAEIGVLFSEPSLRTNFAMLAFGATPGAGKASFYYFDIDGTEYQANDTQTTWDDFYNWPTNQSRTWPYPLAYRLTVTDPLPSEVAWESRLESVMADLLNGNVPGIPVKGFTPLPQNPTEMSEILESEGGFGSKTTKVGRNTTASKWQEKRGERQNARDEKRSSRQAGRQNRKNERQGKRASRKSGRQSKRQGRRDQRKDKRQSRRNRRG